MLALRQSRTGCNSRFLDSRGVGLEVRVVCGVCGDPAYFAGSEKIILHYIFIFVAFVVLISDILF